MLVLVNFNMLLSDRFFCKFKYIAGGRLSVYTEVYLTARSVLVSEKSIGIILL